MEIKGVHASALLLLCALYFVVYTAVEVRSAQTAVALSEAPYTIVIDAGHGGEDGGTTSLTGVLESNINLSISLKLDQLLALCGVKTCMLRSEDVSLHKQGATIRERKISDLNHRVEIINSVNRGILVSIHQNHFAESKYSGAQVFYAGTNGSKNLASQIQQVLNENLASSNQRTIAKAEAVYIMKKINCEGVLIECGFLSNPTEALLLQDDTYQTKLSCVIGCALTRYLQKGEMEVEI